MIQQLRRWLSTRLDDFAARMDGDAGVKFPRLVIPRGIIMAVLGALAGALALYSFMPVPHPEPEISVVYVTAHQFAELEPDADVGIIEKIARPVAKIEQRVSAPGAGQEMVNAFVSAAEAARQGNTAAATGALPDSSAAPDPNDTATAVPRISFSYAGEFDPNRGRIDLFTVVSDGAKERLRYEACGRITWVMTGDSALVQGGRLCWLDDALGITGAAAIGYGIGARDPLAIGVGLLELVARKLIR